MEPKIFVNLPVADVATSRQFYESLGWVVQENFTNDEAACVAASDSIYVMLLARDFFSTFLRGTEVADARSVTQTLLAISAPDRAAVDAMIAQAVEAGGRECREIQDMGFMYGRAFSDLDGHIWEPHWMDPDVAAGQSPEGPASA